VGFGVCNPFVGLRSQKAVIKRWHRVTPQEYHALLAVCPDMRQQVFYCLCYTAGLRLSEAMNLLWSDVDFEHGRVIVANRERTAKIPPSLSRIVKAARYSAEAYNRPVDTLAGSGA